MAEHIPISIPDLRNGAAHVVHFENPRYTRPATEDSPGVYRAQQGKDLHAPKLTLMSDVLVNVRHERYRASAGGESVRTKMVLDESLVFENVVFFHLPVVNGSEVTHDFDDMDPIALDRNQGTLVTNGYLKCVALQTRRRNNWPYITEMRKTSRYAFMCETRSSHREKLRSSSSTKMYLTRDKSGIIPRIVVAIPYIPKKLPITVIFRLLGVANLSGMLELIVGTTQDYETLSRAESVLLACPGHTDPSCDVLNASREDILFYVATSLGGCSATGSVATMSTRTREAHIHSMIKLISTEVFPHLGSDDDEETHRRKAVFMGMVVARMLSVFAGETSVDVIDD